MAENIQIDIKSDRRELSFVLTVDPTFMPDRNMRICFDRDGACEPELTHLLMRVLNEGDVAVDGGANVGFFSCMMSRLVGDSGKVFAVEPTPINVSKIRTNLANNAMRNVEIVFQPLYDHECDVVLHLAQDSGSNALAANPDTSGRMTTKATTLDTILAEHEPVLIKLDIEGSEFAALNGAIETLRRKPYVAVEFNVEALKRMGTSIPAIRQYMRHLGFELFLLQADGSIPVLVPADTVVRPRKLNLMVLFSTVEMVSAAWSEVYCG